MLASSGWQQLRVGCISPSGSKRDAVLGRVRRVLEKNLDTTPVTARSLGNTYHVDGDNLERSYKYHLSDYSTWVQKDHAGDCVLVPDNIGEHLCIDETSLQEDLFTILSNKAGHGRQGTIISMVRGTKACEVIKVLMQIPTEDRLKVKEVTLDMSESMRSIVEQVFPNALITLDCFHIIKRSLEAEEELRLRYKREAQKKSKKLTRDAAKVKLHEWYQAIANCSLREVKSARDAIKDREEYVPNYFINRATNAAAESLNSKLKGLRA